MISHLDSSGNPTLGLWARSIPEASSSCRFTLPSSERKRRSVARNAWPSAFGWQASVADRDRLRAHVLGRSLHATEVGWTQHVATQAIENTEDLEQHTLVYCPEGGATLEVTNRRVTLTAGQAVLLPARTVFRLTSRTRHPVTVSWLRFSGDDSDYYVRTLGEGLSLIFVSQMAGEKFNEAFLELAALLSEEPSEWRLIQSSHLVRLLLGHALGEKRFALPGQAEPHHPSVDAAVDYMRVNLGLPLSLGEIARRAGLSVSHFCALFRSQMGITPMDYLIQLKVQKARRLLITTALTVQEVAQQVGYDDRYYFSRLFRKLNGVPPMDYRQQRRIPS